MFFRSHLSLLLAALLQLAAVSAPFPLAAESTNRLAVTINSVDILQIQDVVTTAGIARIQLTLALQASSKLHVNQVDLRDFSIDNVPLFPRPDTTPFDIEGNTSSSYSLFFDTPITAPMAALTEKFGKRVHLTGSFVITSVQTGFALGKHKPGVGQVMLVGDPIFSTPSENVLAAISHLPALGGGASKGKDSSAGAAAEAEPWMRETRLRASSDVVILEASSSNALGLGTSRVYRQGYRLGENQVVAPLDLLDPFGSQAASDQGALGAAVATVARRLDSGAPQIRAWVGVAGGASSPAPISFSSPTVSMRLKCRLQVGGGSRVNLGIFEFASTPPSPMLPFGIDNWSGSAQAAVVSYSGLMPSQPFSSLTLSTSPLSAQGAGGYLAVSPHVSPAAFGAPVFSPTGVLAVLNGEDSAIAVSEIERAERDGACIADAPAQAVQPAAAAPTAFKIKFISEPAGAVVWIDRKVARNAAGEPIVTGASEEQCTEANTALVAPGERSVTLYYEGYRTVHKDNLLVSRDTALAATLIKEK
jgi:hypothetical protein